ncbi:hypothetical protein ABEB36_013791 [Hypothenemus hampei]|uniref:CCHC-type domain-containing protein n=1 Tax=Hypothenemus hampei TaxID=57062 RepID=A0ABD1E598_HYPHA
MSEPISLKRKFSMIDKSNTLTGKLNKHCFQCGKLGHIQANCRVKKTLENKNKSNNQITASTSQANNEICNFCAKRGHHASNCFTKSAIDKRRNINFCSTGKYPNATKLQIKGNYIDYISEINQFLAICPEEEEIQINCENSIETRKLMGIFLIKKDSCKLYFRKHELSFNEVTHGKPLLMSPLKFIPQLKKILKFEIELKKIGPIEPPVHSLIPINEEDPISTTPSWYTVTLYIMVIGAVVLATTKCYLKRSRSRKSKPTEDTQPADEINLPGDASF